MRFSRGGLRTILADLFLVALTALLAAAVSVVVTHGRAPRYVATAVFTLRDASVDAQTVGLDPSAVQSASEAAAQEIDTFKRTAVLERTAQRMGTGWTPQRVDDDLTVSAQNIGGAIAVRGHARDAPVAARLANVGLQVESELRAQADRDRLSLAVEAARQRLQVARRLHQDAASIRARAADLAAAQSEVSLTSPLEVLSTAEIPDSPSTPSRLHDALVALLVGTILGVGLALAWRTVLRRDQLQLVGRMSGSGRTVGVIPDAALGTVVRPRARRDDPVAEAFRRTAVVLEPIFAEGPTAVAVVSALPEAGKSTVAAGLAFAVAAQGRPVVLVDCDLRRPVLADRLGAASGPGLAEVLGGTVALEDALQPVGPPLPGDGGRAPLTPAFLGAGIARRELAERFNERQLMALLDRLKETFALVVLDTAPVLAVADGLVAAAAADAALVCAREGWTERDAAERAQQQLDRVGAASIGTVVTGVPAHDPAVAGLAAARR